VPVVFLQGEKDEIVDTTNANFARQHLVNAPFLDIRFIRNRYHRLAQFEWPTIRQSILQMSDWLNKKGEINKENSGVIH
jgi:hypothetical protein